ncbi:bis(5'-adenosyl)-triphosphatase ENPP4 [Rhinatrema bivittatum]|uniref:bis(5'-adenosyl)-triphosphatase ENPP4 n=1 Tax=Rhinatrema bivittatum TaxID=194408 RepID=UPI00112E1586|nr:bis(5'-adenosyl)-triphosphatase ENPP4 [Rhinatrema bivittatum]XP_029451932.1 bis(5'-adenosyl)-triphosphatase ENPP4 [Rhinatrema bivittatum]
MKMLSRVNLILTVIVSGFVNCHGNNTTNSTAPKLLLVSLDGFRADYLSNYSLPNLQNFIKEGVLVEHVTNVFITKTFPNHHTIVTGLYAESHGIVANNMYDPVANKTFSPSNKNDSFWWNESTPIWLTNQMEGHKSGAAMWPGSDIPYLSASLFLPYNPKITFEQRVDTVTMWLTSPNDPVNFAMLYWHEPDESGHKYGPEDVAKMTIALREVDMKIDYLVKKLKSSGLWETLNVIITSDHGMAQCSQDRIINLDDCINRTSYTLVDESPVAAILPGPQTNKTQIYNALKNCSSYMKAYLKEDIPDRYHYKHNSRIQPIILVANEGWMFVRNKSLATLGNHGYDNALPSMHPFLAAHGPAFRKGYKQNTINSVDIYPMMCHILGLKGMANNGSFENTKCLLSDQWCIRLPEAIGIVVGVIMVLTTLTCLIIIMKNKVSSPRTFSRLQLQEDDDDLLIE